MLFWEIFATVTTLFNLPAFLIPKIFTQVMMVMVITANSFSEKSSKEK